MHINHLMISSCVVGAAVAEDKETQLVHIDEGLPSSMCAPNLYYAQHVLYLARTAHTMNVCNLCFFCAAYNIYGLGYRVGAQTLVRLLAHMLCTAYTDP